MSEDARSKAIATRRILYVANPGSDSDGDSDDDSHLRDNYSKLPSSISTSQSYSYQSQSHQPAPYAPVYSPNTRPSGYHPTPLTTNLPPDHTHHYQHSNPTLSSPSSTSSPAAESTPPPSTPGIAAPPVDLSGEAPSNQDLGITPYIERGGDNQQQLSTSRKLFQSFKSPFHHHRASHLPRPASSPKRPATSPTVSTPDSYNSQSSQGSNYTVSEKVLIVVTSDSERYLTVDITGAGDPAFIRERIFNKLCVWDEEDQSQFSIYQTEIGAFAIGEALTDEQLFELCRDQGDPRGSLKFFVSHSSATVHEQPSSHSSSSLSPTVNTIPPPVLPFNSGGYAPLQPRRRRRSTRSRQNSVSSASEQQQPLEVAAGYEADLDNPDRETHRTTIRPPPPPPVSSNPPPSPNNRRPNVVTRPISPLSRPNSPPPVPPDRGRALGNDAPSLIDKYGLSVPAPPPPPPLSPNRASFPMHDDHNSLSPPPAKHLHIRAGSDAAAERERALRTSENHVENSTRQWRHQQQMAGRVKQDRSREHGQGQGQGQGQGKDSRQRSKRQQSEMDESQDKVGQTDSWVVVPRDVAQGQDQNSTSTSQAQAQTSLHRTRIQPSPIRHKRSPYSTRALTIPEPPRVPPPAVPKGSETRIPLPPRPAGVPVPPNWTVTWKGEEKGDQKTMSSSSPQWSRMKSLDKAKSMDNLRAAAAYTHPANLQPGGGRNRPPQLPMTRQTKNNGIRDAVGFSGGGTYIPQPGGSTSSGLPKSYEGVRQPVRPLPMQGSAHGSSLDLGPSTPNLYGGRPPIPSPRFIPSGTDPYPRPQSAFGDTLTSPSQRYQRHLQSPTGMYGTSLDTIIPPLVLSPSGHQQQASGGLGLRLNVNYGDVHNGTNNPYDSRSPPRSPASPASPRHSARERDGSSPSAERLVNDNRMSEATLRPDERSWMTQMLNGNSSDVDNNQTFMPPRRADPDATPVPSSSSNSPSEFKDSPPPTFFTPLYDDNDSDSDDNGTGTWIKRPTVENTYTQPKSPSRGPALKLQVPVPDDNKPSSSSYLLSSPKNPQTRLPALQNPHKASQRESTFSVSSDTTWAPRPTAEDMYNRLDAYFPQPLLDQPVSDALSGGTSPTELAAAPVAVADKSRRSKKSIRVVAQEKHRNSRTDTAVSRKRSTKLWGSRVEEVTTAKPGSPVSESPSGGPTTFKWVRGELIGRGTYGRVYLALNATTGEMIAVKQVEIPRTASDKNDSRQVSVVQALKLESETLKDLDHPNIVQYLGFEETPSNLSIFLEYVPGGSIGSCLLKHGKFDEDVTKSFTGQILRGLEYLHSKGILHRDLKADNILVETSGQCKISDFGISKRTDEISGGAFTAMQGTVFWMAPEVINTQKKGYNFKIDIWSVGCVVLEMWAGMRPWMGDEAVAVMFKLYQSKLPPPVPDDVVLSPLADDFRLKCFAINPEERPTAAELRNHPYLILPPGWVFNGF